jgi:hypothetical protein
VEEENKIMTKTKEKVNRGEPSQAVVDSATSYEPSAKAKAVQNDKLDALKSMASKARDLEHEISDLNDAIKEKSQELRDLYHIMLPNLMDEVGVDSIGVPPKGNLPGVDYQLKPYFSAGIAQSWAKDRKEEAFAFLKDHKADSLIKTEILTKLPVNSVTLAKKILKETQRLTKSMGVV